MHDPRVRRGNTWSMFNWHGPLQNAKQGKTGRNGGDFGAGGDPMADTDPVKLRKRAENERRKAARLRAERLQQLGPPPVPGRRHSLIQTDLYLEELAAVPDEQAIECQTDSFLDRPPTPIFMPAKTGADAGTQIYDGDLFDFNVEVKPILEILVGKVTEQALLEVLQEEELASVRAQQRAYEEIRNAELAEQQRLEEEERRRVEEKERRKLQELQLEEKRREAKSKIAAQAFAKSFLHDLVPGVFEKLTNDGYFYDPVERDTERYFIPWLMENVENNLMQHDAAELILQDMIRQVVEERIIQYSKPLETAKPPPAANSNRSSKKTSLFAGGNSITRPPEETPTTLGVTFAADVRGGPTEDDEGSTTVPVPPLDDEQQPSSDLPPPSSEPTADFGDPSNNIPAAVTDENEDDGEAQNGENQ